MSPTIEDQTREEIAKLLPQAIQKTLESYHRFTSSNIEETVKEFSAYHTACKAAIAHLDLLLKLARWAEGHENDQNSTADLENLIHSAKADLLSYESRPEKDKE